MAAVTNSQTVTVKALIFGINGQDGYYLSRLCHEKGIEYIGISRSEGDWIRGDVSDFVFVRELIKKHQPDYIFHLAANSTTHHGALFENHETISTGSVAILEAVWKESSHSKVFLTGSGIQFENSGKAIAETDEFAPTSAYSVARIQSVYAARYFRSLGLKVYVGYLFHHESIFRKQHHVSTQIVEAIKRIQQGSNEVLEIGDLSVQKEWGYAADIAAAILTLVQQDSIFEATIGTGKAHSIQQWVVLCFEHIGLDWQDYVSSRPFFASDYPILVSNPATIQQLGWSPTVSIDELAKKMMLGEL